jgi:hypothetical protein
MRLPIHPHREWKLGMNGDILLLPTYALVVSTGKIYFLHVQNDDDRDQRLLYSSDTDGVKLGTCSEMDVRILTTICKTTHMDNLIIIENSAKHISI